MLTALLDRNNSDVSGDLENFFIMAMYWSLGAPLIEESRLVFDQYARRIACFMEAPEGRPPSIGNVLPVNE